MPGPHKKIECWGLWSPMTGSLRLSSLVTKKSEIFPYYRYNNSLNSDDYPDEMLSERYKVIPVKVSYEEPEEEK